MLALAIAILLVIGGPIGAELYVRQAAASKVANAVQCEIEDSADVSFAATPPVVWQYITHHYTKISVQTAGNQVRSAKGMQASIDVQDIRLNHTADSSGTIGAINGTITWTAAGIRDSIQGFIPVVGSLVTGEVTTRPSDGTIELKGLLDRATLKPHIVDNGLALQVVSLSALGSKLSTDTVQKNLDKLTSKATKDYPLGIHADSVKVTDTGVEATFSAKDSTIPASQSGGDTCFSGV